MIEESLCGEAYEKLYASYLSHPDNALLLAANMQPGESVLDLCCGNMRQTEAAFKMGARHVTAVDMCKHMQGCYHRTPNVFFQYIEDHVDRYLRHHCINLASKSAQHHPYDVICCQQAINYWIDQKTAIDVSKIMLPTSRFVFNTFNTCAPSEPTFKIYKFNGLNYAEAFQHVCGRIYHMQMCEGMEPHCTAFSWISPEQFHDILSPCFDYEKITSGVTGRSDTYVCRLKK